MVIQLLGGTEVPFIMGSNVGTRSDHTHCPVLVNRLCIHPSKPNSYAKLPRGSLGLLRRGTDWWNVERYFGYSFY